MVPTSAVIPRDNPTVHRAETTSKMTSFAPIPSTAQMNMEETRTRLRGG